MISIEESKVNFKSASGNKSLMVFDLNSKQDQDTFKVISSQIGQISPFSSLEYILDSKTELQSLKYFSYFVNNQPKILMPFYFRPIFIQGAQTPYNDVISPYGYSGPIFNQNLETQCIDDFWKSVDLWYRDHNVISEFMRFSLNKNFKHYSGCIVPTLNTVRGEIIDSEKQWANFKKKVRNNIRKASKNNLSSCIFFESIDKSVISDFYRIYLDTLNRNKAQDRYYYRQEYFENLVQNMKDHCAIAIIKKDKRPVSAEFLILSEDTIISHLGGTDSEYFDLRPNDFLKYNVLNWGREKGFKYYNLGGGMTNYDTLYSYKKSFFPLDKDEIFYSGRKIIDNIVYNQLVDLVRSNSGDYSKTSVPQKCEGFFPKYRLEKIDKI